jgi:predicted metal-dependent HD superfamily phosphohydrolase
MEEILKKYTERYRSEHVSEMEVLTTQYTEPHRRYHTLEHITYMFMKAREHKIQLTRAQTHAIWWHDAVYVPGSATNEEDSVHLAHDYHNHLQDPDWLNICMIIMDTKTHEPRSEESAIVCDLDMLILADVAVKYRRYAKQVRTEFSKYSDEEYRQGRIQFLGNMLLNPIFHSMFFKQYENEASENIKNEIWDLKSCSL